MTIKSTFIRGCERANTLGIVRIVVVHIPITVDIKDIVRIVRIRDRRFFLILTLKIYYKHSCVVTICE